MFGPVLVRHDPCYRCDLQLFTSVFIYMATNIVLSSNSPGVPRGGGGNSTEIISCAVFRRTVSESDADRVSLCFKSLMAISMNQTCALF